MKIKPFEKLSFHDDFMFGHIMKDREVSKTVLEILLDIASILKGQEYRDLKESIIIFLCRFDPFQKGIPCYTISRTCREDGSIQLNDKSTLYIYNCKAYENAENTELRALLKYIETDITESDFTRRLYGMVEAQKEEEGLKTSYIAWGLFAQDKVYEGRQEGREETKIENARNFLAMGVGTHEQIAQGVGLPLETVKHLAQEIASEKSV